MGDTIQILEKPERKDAAYCEKLLKLSGVKVDTEEVLLAHKGLEEICSFKHLKCLEALWLNDNKLTKVVGLNTNVQIKALYLHNNKITTLDGSLKHLRHIRTLTLYNNRLQDLMKTLPKIEHLSHLEELDLTGNPLANELNYRQRVIHTFPNLHVLDRHQISDEERLAAKELFEGHKSSSICFNVRKPLWKNPPAQPIASLSLLGTEMYRDIDKYQAAQERERKRKEDEAMSRPVTHAKTVPIAKAVEEVNMHSRTLKDVVEDIEKDFPPRTPEKLPEGVRGPEHTYKNDFFLMKRYETTRPLPSAATKTTISRPGSIVSQSNGNGVKLMDSLESNAISIDSQMHTQYQTLRNLGPEKTTIRDWSTAL